jgi:hypothetical protein
MRKLTVVVLALVGVLVAAAVAYAANTYTVTPASSTPHGKGSKKKPLPKKVLFGYRVATDNGSISSPIKTYAINFEGLTYFGKKLPKCTYAQTNANPVSSKCKKAKVGGGIIEAKAGPTGSPASAAVKCNLKLSLYNIGTGFGIRIDGGPGVFVTGPVNGRANCPQNQHRSINGKITKAKVGGISGGSLKFNVAQELRHIGPLDVGLVNVSSSVSGKARKVKIGHKRLKVSVLSATGCKGSTRIVQVKFTDESGKTTPAQKAGPC